MSGVLHNQKKAELIDQERSYINGLQLCLFDNNHTPADADTEANYTEPTDSGYSRQSIAMGTATLNGSNQGQLLGTTVTWTFNHDAGDFTIYGYWFRDPADGKSVLAERAAAPFAVTAAGQTFTVTPKKVMTTG